jgi:hypothetical protein
MPSFNSGPGTGGIVGIVGGIIGVGILMSLTLDLWSHWIPIVAAIIVGLWAVRSINR